MRSDGKWLLMGHWLCCFFIWIKRYLADLNEMAKIPQLCDRSTCFSQVIDELIIRLINIIIKSDCMKYYLSVCKTKFWLSYWRSMWISNTCFFAQMYARFFTHTSLKKIVTVEFCDGPRRLGISVISLITTITCPLWVFLCFSVEYKFFNGSLACITQTGSGFPTVRSCEPSAQHSWHIASWQVDKCAIPWSSHGKVAMMSGFMWRHVTAHAVSKRWKLGVNSLCHCIESFNANSCFWVLGNPRSVFAVGWVPPLEVNKSLPEACESDVPPEIYVNSKAQSKYNSHLSEILDTGSQGFLCGTICFICHSAARAYLLGILPQFLWVRSLVDLYLIVYDEQ